MPWAVLFPALVVACYTDARWRLIRNWLTLPLMAGGLLWHAWQEGWTGLGTALLGGAIAFSAGFVGGPGAGGGDLKLLLAVGTWLGSPMAAVLWAWLAIVRFIDAVLVRLVAARFRWRAFWEGVVAETAAILGRLPWEPPRSLPGAWLITAAVLLTAITLR